MKKIIFQLGVLSFAIVLIACETKKPEGLSSSVTPEAKEAQEAKEVATPVIPERSYILVSQLALKGYLASPQAKMPETKALYSAAQNDTRELANISQSKDKKVDQSSVMMSKTVDLCPCSTGSGLCPCPGDTTATALAARVNQEVKVKFDGKSLKSSKSIEGNNSWDVFKWPADVKNGNYKLVINGKFATDKAQAYEVPVTVENGKFYLKWE